MFVEGRGGSKKIKKGGGLNVRICPPPLPQNNILPGKIPLFQGGRGVLTLPWKILER